MKGATYDSCAHHFHSFSSVYLNCPIPLQSVCPPSKLLLIHQASFGSQGISSLTLPAFPGQMDVFLLCGWYTVLLHSACVLPSFRETLLLICSCESTRFWSFGAWTLHLCVSCPWHILGKESTARRTAAWMNASVFYLKLLKVPSS